MTDEAQNQDRNLRHIRTTTPEPGKTVDIYLDAATLKLYASVNCSALVPIEISGVSV